MVTRKIVVQGLVQGIGFRPFVAELAEQLHIAGWVRNTNGIVTIMAQSDEATISLFVEKIRAEAPVGAIITKIDCYECKGKICEGKENNSQNKETYDSIIRKEYFAIIESERTDKESFKINKEEKKKILLIPADLPTCDRCRNELYDKNNRRYRHPFISCTSCGPRYSIIHEIPYDREHIAMNIFSMCPECAAEYQSKGNIRRHAQTIACRECGPTLTFLLDNEKGRIKKENEDAMQAAITYLQEGGILAIKDIGGFHLAADPFDEAAIDKLRMLKGREAKPFAVMFPNVESVEEFCSLGEMEKELLLSPPRPIVLLRKRTEGRQLHPKVCGTSPDIGVILPCNPVQILLTDALGPLIMTSANVTGALITTENEQMEQWLAKKIAILEHDRPILTPLDDSIVRVVQGKKQTLRRARGLVPTPIPFPSEKEIFAAGGDLKSAFCYTGGGLAYLSQHLGDLEEVSCFDEYKKQVRRMRDLFGFTPERLAFDLHPGYLSTSYATVIQNNVICSQQEKQLVQNQAYGEKEISLQVQHHKAHIASVIAEHDIKGDVLGFAFDGTGFGEDGSVWGSEVFLCTGVGSSNWKMNRVAHLKPVQLIGGDEGAKNTDTILYGFLSNILDDNELQSARLQERHVGVEKEEPQGNIALAKREALQNTLECLRMKGDFDFKRFQIVYSAILHHINCIKSSSMGRLFDAVSALLGICHYNSYEGQAPIELENLAVTAETGYPLHISIEKSKEPEEWLMDTTDLFCDLAAALASGEEKASLARGFIEAVSAAVVQMAEFVKVDIEYHMAGTDYITSDEESVVVESEPKSNRKYSVVLSGGTFLNRILLETVSLALEEKGFTVYRNEEVPPGDGGICLGQAYFAAYGLEV